MFNYAEIKNRAYHNFSIIPELAEQGYSRKAIASLTGLTEGTVQNELLKMKKAPLVAATI